MAKLTKVPVASDSKVRDAAMNWRVHLQNKITEKATEMPDDESAAATNRMLCLAWKSTISILDYVLDGVSPVKGLDP